MRKRFPTLLPSVLLALLLLPGCGRDVDYTAFVNPRIGSGGHGHVFVGANVPFGMVQVGPTSIPQSWDWCSGYHDSDSTVIGFSHMHLSGTGIGDLFDVTVMPVTGEVTYARGTSDIPGSGLWSYADRSREVVRPGYYKVPLTRYGITAEMTSTARTGLHRYTFPSSDEAAVVFDLENGGCWDRADSTWMSATDDRTIEGFRFSKGWAAKQKVYFYARFSKPFKEFRTIDEHYGRACFSTSEGEQILLKVALSPVSPGKARMNMEAELPGWDFEATEKAARKAWNDELSKVELGTSDGKAREIFYTSLYHTMIAPSLWCDVDGAYRGCDGLVHEDPGFVNYTTFSLWDTYRAQMPLMSILHGEKMPDIVQTMLHIYDEQGKLPVWHLMSNETDCMVGNPGVIATADALVKGFPGFDREKAFEAMKASVMLDERSQDLRKEYGYIPSDKTNYSIAKDMEYAIADAGLAHAAAVLGKADDEAFFTGRSHSWRNYYDPSTGFVRGKFADGTFRTPFSPYAADHVINDYIEGNAWQYTWLVPQDLEGIEALKGGREAMLESLDSLFKASSHLEGDNPSGDITGMIGQYVHGNEPSHHVIYLYTMAGRRDKAAPRIREVLTTLYDNTPDGLCGNEDVGQMSAWYVLSSLGIYQAEPASTRFWFGSPIFEKAVLKVPGGTFTIITHNNSPENCRISSVRLNGREYDKDYIEFGDIVSGGVLEFEMQR